MNMPSRSRFPLVRLTLAAALIPSFLAGPVEAGETTKRVKTTVRDTQLTLTLQDAIQKALASNPDIQKQLQEIQRTRGVILEVTGQALPNLVSNSSFTNTDNKLRTGGSGGSSGIPSGLFVVPLVNGGTLDLGNLFSSGSSISTGNSTWSVNVQVRQLIYNGGATGAAIRAAKLTRDNSYYQLRETVETVVGTVKNQFNTVLLNESLIKIQEEQVGLLASQLKDQQNRFDAGTIPRFDVLQAEVALANQRPQLINAQNQFRLSQIQLARTLGHDYVPDRQERPPFRLIGRLEMNAFDVSIPQAIALAEANRATLLLARQNIAIQQEQLSISKAGYQPTINATATYQFQNDRRTGGDLTHSDNGYILGVTANWNIFDGGTTYGKVRQARANLISSGITYEDTHRGVELDVQDALFRLRQSRELVNSQRENVGKAEEALRLSRAKLGAGAGTQLDVLNSQVALTQAQVTELQARYSFNVAASDLRRVTGTSAVYFDNFTDPVSRQNIAARRGAGSLAPRDKLSRPRKDSEKIDAVRAGALVPIPTRDGPVKSTTATTTTIVEPLEK